MIHQIRDTSPLGCVTNISDWTCESLSSFCFLSYNFCHFSWWWFWFSNCLHQRSGIVSDSTFLYFFYFFISLFHLCHMSNTELIFTIGTVTFHYHITKISHQKSSGKMLSTFPASVLKTLESDLQREAIYILLCDSSEWRIPVVFKVLHGALSPAVYSVTCMAVSTPCVLNTDQLIQMSWCYTHTRSTFVVVFTLSPFKHFLCVYLFEREQMNFHWLVHPSCFCSYQSRGWEPQVSHVGCKNRVAWVITTSFQSVH